MICVACMGIGLLQAVAGSGSRAAWLPNASLCQQAAMLQAVDSFCACQG